MSSIDIYKADNGDDTFWLQLKQTNNLRCLRQEVTRLTVSCSDSQFL